MLLEDCLNRATGYGYHCWHCRHCVNIPKIVNIVNSMLHLVHLLCQLLTLLNGSFTKTFSSNLSTLAVVGCSLRANIQWDLFRCSRHRTSHHLYISIMSTRIIKTNQKLFFRPSIVETSRHSFGNEFLTLLLSFLLLEILSSSREVNWSLPLTIDILRKILKVSGEEIEYHAWFPKFKVNYRICN